VAILSADAFSLPSVQVRHFSPDRSPATVSSVNKKVRPHSGKLLIMRPVSPCDSVACVGDGETAVGQGRHLDGIHRPSSGRPSRMYANPQVAINCSGELWSPASTRSAIARDLQSGRFLDISNVERLRFFLRRLSITATRDASPDHHRSWKCPARDGHDYKSIVPTRLLGQAIMFLVPRQIAKIDHRNFPGRSPSQIAYFHRRPRLLRLIPRLEIRATMISGPGARQRF